MKKEDAIKYLKQLYPNGGHCWLDEQRIEAIGMAVEALQEEPVSEDLNNEIRKYFLSYKGYPHVMDETEREIKKAIIYFANWQKAKDEAVTKDLGDYINELSKQFPEVSFAKLSRIAVRVAKWQKQQDQSTIELAEDHAMLAGMEKMKEQMTKDIWKPADGDDLPEIDREVIALLDNGKVVFAHRPPEYWDGKDIITGKVTRNYVERYDKGLWNIPNVKWWLDVYKLPNVEE